MKISMKEWIEPRQGDADAPRDDYKFDPHTGQPIERKMRFDPYTGKPLEADSTQAGPSAPQG